VSGKQCSLTDDSSLIVTRALSRSPAPRPRTIITEADKWEQKRRKKDVRQASRKKKSAMRKAAEGRAEEEEADDEGEEPLETSGIRARSAKEQTHVDMMNRGASFPVEFHEESGLEESGDESIGAVACACAGTSIC
jgi:hypothetical protein